MKTLPFMARKLSIHLLSLLMVSLGLLTLPQRAVAGPLVGVFQGEEIVVSLNPGASLPGAMQGAQLAALVRPAGLSMKPLVGTRRVGVLSYSTTSTTRSRKVVQVDSAIIAQHCQRIIASNPGTSMSCEANTVVKAVRYPNDPGFSQLWGMRIMGAPVAWDMSTGSKSITVAVVDTGIERTHPDLAVNMLTNSREINGNGIDDDSNGYVDDFYGYDFYSQDGDPNDEFFHGTHCAGTIGGVGNNSRGVTGVAWNVSLLGVRIMGPTGSGSIADLALGIQYAVSRGASVINLSLGAGQSSAVENAITEARLKDVVIVAAAGNSGSDNDLNPFYPASSPSDNVIAVAASDATDTLTSWSNYGATSVDVAAPGDGIYSTILNGQYGIASGTSMATPHVAGIIAVMRSVNPSLTYTQVKNILINSAQRLTSMQGKVVASGRANFFRAVLAAGGAIPTPTPEPTFTPTPTPVPTATPTATATPTPTPIPYTVSLSAEKLGKFTRFFGTAVNVQGAPITPLFVDLVCGGQYRASGRTNLTGGYEVLLNSLSAGLSCYVQDEFGIRSATIISP